MGFYNILDINNSEHMYHMANMSEAHWLMGVTCTFIPCLSYTRDANSDPYPVLGNPVDINIVFDDNPKATLKKHNWLAEDEDIPYLANISSIVYDRYREWKKPLTPAERKQKLRNGVYNQDGSIKSEFEDFVIKVSEYAIIEMPYRLNAEGVQKFSITDVKGDSINPFMWMCKLAPYHEPIDLMPESTDCLTTKLCDDEARFQFLKTDEFKKQHPKRVY